MWFNFLPSKSGFIPLFENLKNFEPRPSSFLFWDLIGPRLGFRVLGSSPCKYGFRASVKQNWRLAKRKDPRYIYCVLSQISLCYERLCQILFSSRQALSNDFTCRRKLWRFHVITTYRQTAESSDIVMLIWAIHNFDATPCCVTTIVCKLCFLL